MPVWLTIVLYVVSILTIVVIHEAGHFFTAKAFGIKVQEFFVGFGPRLWSTRRGETEYGLKALPFGGYVRIAGMNPFEDVAEEDLPRTFQAKPIWQRAMVIFAGPVTHFVIAVLLFAVFFTVLGVPNGRPVIGQVCPLNETSSAACPATGQTSPAQLAGLRPGDLVVAVDGRKVDTADQLVTFTRAHVGESVAVTVERDGRRITVHATPALSTVGGAKVGRLGVILESARDRTNPIVGLGRGVTQTVEFGKQVFIRLGQVFGPSGLKRIGEQLVGSAPRTSNDVQSIVGGGRVAVQAAQSGAWEALLLILVSFNVFIGILNLLPLPPLDGGHLAVLLYEKVRRRRPDVRKLIPLTALVAAFMILFALSVTYLDIFKPTPNPFR